jgi:hypothetical protein
MTSFRWRTTGLLAVTLAAATVMLVACAGDSPINIDGGGPPASPTPLDVTFRTGVVPQFNGGTSPACDGAGCHLGPTTGQGGLNLGGGGMTADQIYTELTTPALSGMIPVNTANAASSEVLLKPLMGDATVHTGGKLWKTTDTSYKKVLGWIQAGAQNN